MNTVMSNDKDGCKKLKDGEVNETHEAMEFTKEYTKNCKMSLSNINECACDTSAEFQQVRRIYVIEFFLLYVPRVTFIICAPKISWPKSSLYCHEFLIEGTTPRTAPLVDS
jgi:hypothetical protein